MFKASLLHRGDDDELEFELDDDDEEEMAENTQHSDEECGSENALDVHEFANGPQNDILKQTE